MLMPFHLEQLLVPFACIERSKDLWFVSATPDTMCDMEKDPRYREMVHISMVMGTMMLLFYSGMVYQLWQSFVWQSGCVVRDHIPFYVGMTEISVFGQRGFVPEVRRRVMSNLVSVQIYESKASQIEKRGRLEMAANTMGPRSRRVQAAAKKAGITLGEVKGEADVGETEQESAKGRAEILNAIDRFRGSKHMWPQKTDGNLVTYGWILLVNMFWRQLISLMVLKQTEGRLVVVGAAFIMLIYAGNVTMLLVFRPYKSKKVTNTETTLLTALFAMLWCAVMKDLLSNHVNAYTFEETLNKFNQAIDIFACCLMVAVFFIPLAQVVDIFSDLAKSFRSPDTLLNDIYMTASKKAEDASKAEVAAQRVKEVEDGAAESSMLLPIYMEEKFPCLSKALEQISQATMEPSAAQRRSLRKFVQLARNFRSADMSKVNDNAMSLLGATHAMGKAGTEAFGSVDEGSSLIEMTAPFQIGSGKPIKASAARSSRG